MLTLTTPQALYLLAIPVAMFFYFLLKKRDRAKPFLLRLSKAEGFERRRSHVTRWIFRGLFLGTLLAMGTLAYVIARPVQVSTVTKRIAEGIDILIVLDVSESMDADDFKPSRILFAKEVITSFIRRRSDDRIGLVLFGGEAITKVPLTRDYDFLLSQVDDIKLRELKQGTAIGMGLANGVSRLRTSESKTKIIVLLTDGDSNVGSVNPITAAHLARQENIKIYSIGIGKEDRVVIPIYAHDIYGRKLHLVGQVPSYINPELLKEISRITGGRSYMARDNQGLAAILREVDGLEKSPVKILATPKREEAYYWPALIATIVLAITFLLQETRYRKGTLGSAI